MDELIGKQIVKITGLEEGSDEVYITTHDGTFMFYHDQNCCENVRIVDLELGSDNFEGAFILSAKEVSSNNEPAPTENSESYTWTFYKIETTKGEIWMRWLGESNGWYSEEVSFKRIK